MLLVVERLEDVDLGFLMMFLEASLHLTCIFCSVQSVALNLGVILVTEGLYD